MKKLLLLLTIIPIMGLSQETYTEDMIIFMDPDLAYIKETKQPLTGIIISKNKRAGKVFSYWLTEEYYKEGKHFKMKEFEVSLSKKTLLYEENYKDGELHGESVFYLDGLVVDARENYKDGQLHGLSTFYDEGKPIDQTNYVDGWKEWEKGWNEVGTLIYEINYKNGYLSGTSKAWYDNGQLKYERSFNGGRVTGSLKRWFENGEVMHDIVFDNGTGVDREYSSPGNLYMETFFKNGMIEGKQTKKYPEMYEVNWKNGTPNGNFICWGLDSKKIMYKRSEGSYIDGMLDGNCKEWHSNNQLYKEYNFVNGQADGMCKVWYESGELKSELLFSEGSNISSKYFYIDGTLHYEIDYTNFNKENEFLKSINIFFDHGARSHEILLKGKRGRDIVSVQCWQKNGKKMMICKDIKDIQQTIYGLQKTPNDFNKPSLSVFDLIE
jgi:antitoxin component YwqK of YwqJK toxin-antitoxin module